MRNASFGLFFGLFLTSCAAAGHQAPESAPAPVICGNKVDCDAKWSRAISWVVKNSQWKIETQTNLLIQTYSSTRGSPSPAFTITRLARPDGTYEITFAGGCANIFGCVPTVAESRTSFTSFVNGMP